MTTNGFTDNEKNDGAGVTVFPDKIIYECLRRHVKDTLFQPLSPLAQVTDKRC
jgi:hypothetical protein